jgi:hypothetical protein
MYIHTKSGGLVDIQYIACGNTLQLTERVIFVMAVGLAAGTSTIQSFI